MLKSTSLKYKLSFIKQKLQFLRFRLNCPNLVALDFRTLQRHAVAFDRAQRHQCHCVWCRSPNNLDSGKRHAHDPFHKRNVRGFGPVDYLFANGIGEDTDASSRHRTEKIHGKGSRFALKISGCFFSI